MDRSSVCGEVNIIIKIFQYQYQQLINDLPTSKALNALNNFYKDVLKNLIDRSHNPWPLHNHPLSVPKYWQIRIFQPWA